MPSNSTIVSREAAGAIPRAAAPPKKPMRSSQLIAMHTFRLERGYKVQEALAALYTVGVQMKPFEEECTEQAMEKYAEVPEYAKLVANLKLKFADLRRQEERAKGAAAEESKADKQKVVVIKYKKKQTPLRKIDRSQLKTKEKTSTGITPLRSGTEVHRLALHKDKLPLWKRMEQFN